MKATNAYLSFLSAIASEETAAAKAAVESFEKSEGRSLTREELIGQRYALIQTTTGKAVWSFCTDVRDAINEGIARDNIAKACGRLVSGGRVSQWKAAPSRFREWLESLTPGAEEREPNWGDPIECEVWKAAYAGGNLKRLQAAAEKAKATMSGEAVTAKGPTYEERLARVLGAVKSVLKNHPDRSGEIRSKINELF